MQSLSGGSFKGWHLTYAVCLGVGVGMVTGATKVRREQECWAAAELGLLLDGACRVGLLRGWI